MAKKLGYLDPSTLASIGDAIRTKNGESDNYTLAQMPAKILAITTGDSDTADATATAQQILKDATAYVAGTKITGTIESKAAQTYAPSESDQVIDAGVYLSGSQTISAVTADNLPENMKETKTVTAELKNQVDVTPTTGKVLTKVTVNAPDMSAANVTVENLVRGVKAYDATGSLITGTHDETTLADMTSDATASESDILPSKTAYANGAKITGTMSTKAAATYQPSDSDQTISAGQYLSGAQTIAAVTADNIPTNLKETKTVDASIASATTVTPTTGKVLTSVTVNAPDTTGTAAESDILSGKTAYVNGAKVTGSITTATPVTTTIVPGGTTTVSAGYYEAASSISASLATTAAQIDSTLKTSGTTETIVPGGSTTISAGKYYTSATTVSASLASTEDQIDSTLKAAGSATTIVPGASTTVSAGKYYTTAATVSASLASSADQIDSTLKAAGSTETIVPGGSATIAAGKYYTSATTVSASLASTETQIDSTLKTTGSTETIVPGGSATIAAGKYYTSGSTVTASLATTADQIDSTLKAAGTTGTIIPGGSTTIAGGKYYTSGTIISASLATTADQVDDTAKETKTEAGSLTADVTVTATTGKLMTAVTVSKPDMSAATATAADIVSGKTAYGSDGTLITGSHTETSGSDTTDATATTADIVSGKTAYIADGKVTGTLEVVTVYQGSDEPESATGETGDLYVYIDMSVTVTKKLTHTSISNTSSKATLGESYTATLTAANDYTLNTVAVTMAGTDVTSTVYDSDTATITIDSVTGAIVITAVSTSETVLDAVGTLDDTTTYGAITLNDTLDADTYTLYYEDETETKLDGWDAIAMITKS